MTRLHHDLGFVSSVGLLVSAIATAVTGIVADLWDLNDFWYHTLAGYVMVGFGLAHVWLSRTRLIGYARYRWRTLRGDPGRGGTSAGPPVPARAETSAPADRPATSLPGSLARAAMSRRGLLGLLVGSLGGLVVGRGLRPPPQIEAGSDVGVVYHQWSKPGIIDALGSVANWGQPVDLYKTYPGVPVMALPEPRVEGGPPAGETIASRRSVREYADAPMTRDELSRLLFLAGGISADRFGSARRTAPSSGALYPIEIYPVVHRVEGIEPGVYHYAVREHALEGIRAGDLRSQVVDQALSQTFLGECGVVLFLTLILQRMRPKYQDRSYRYGLLEAGHIGENAYLAATSMGLGACGVGAFLDDSINEMLGVDGVEEAAVYMVAVGKRAAAA